jgi:general secretion pathway protein F
MPAYSFEALDAQGQTRKGVLEADSVKSARGQLRAQALIPLAVQTVDGTPGTPGSTRLGWSRRVFNTTQLTVWTRQLAGLVSSGCSSSVR